MPIQSFMPLTRLEVRKFEVIKRAARSPEGEMTGETDRLF